MLTIQQAAKWSPFSESAIRRHVEAGRLPAERIASSWLIRADDLLAFMKEVGR
jgi:excisionase family DNA binding protein